MKDELESCMQQLNAWQPTTPAAIEQLEAKLEREKTLLLKIAVVFLLAALIPGGVYGCLVLVNDTSLWVDTFKTFAITLVTLGGALGVIGMHKYNTINWSPTYRTLVRHQSLADHRDLEAIKTFFLGHVSEHRLQNVRARLANANLSKFDANDLLAQINRVKDAEVRENFQRSMAAGSSPA